MKALFKPSYFIWARIQHWELTPSVAGVVLCLRIILRLQWWKSEILPLDHQGTDNINTLDKTHTNRRIFISSKKYKIHTNIYICATQVRCYYYQDPLEQLQYPVATLQQVPMFCLWRDKHQALKIVSESADQISFRCWDYISYNIRSASFLHLLNH